VTLRRALPALLQAALIFALSSRPGDAYPDVSFPGADKLVHFALYAPLGAALVYALGGHWRWAGLLAALYGVSDELHQMFVPMRFADGFDVLADAAGGFVGAWLMARRGARHEPRAR
jgi:VanZ family protein